jgi:hypothetical protein
VAQLSDLISRVRLELGDQPSQFTYSTIADGTNTMFDLNAKYIEISTLYVTVNGVPKAYPTNYSLDATHGQITFTATPVAGAVVRVEGEGYRYFLDDDICTFVNTAVTQHSHNRSDAMGSQVTIASIQPVEEYPIAILATIEALWILATDSSFDINITAPDGVMIPRAQRFQQLTTIIQQRMEQYRQLCSALNIGLWRIEMGTLRRVSRLTNKLVPVYLAQEIDDARRPERVYIENNLLGRTPMPTTAQNYDIALYQGDSYEVEFDFPFDTSALTFKAQVRTYPNAPSLYASFTITTVSTSANLSKIKLSLTSSATKYMPVRAFWDLQATAASDPDYQVTFIKGQVFTTQQVTSD